MQSATTFADISLPGKIASGAIGIIPTDTLYGLVASARLPEAVAKTYSIKHRAAHKPCIILIDSPERALEFGVDPNALSKVIPYWPGPLSVIFDAISPRYDYLCRDLGAPPFRVPDRQDLREFLARTGPLIAPSANIESEPPAATIQEAQQAFGPLVDFYVDGGELRGAPSTVARVKNDGSFEIIRQGKMVITTD